MIPLQVSVDLDLGHVPNAAERKDLAKLAQVRSVSDETWAVAIDIYRERTGS